MDIQPSKDQIIFELHNPCGLFNQVTCIENAVALSYFLKKDILIHHIFNEPWRKEIEKGVGIYSANHWWNKRKLVNNKNTPKITDLMDVHTYSDISFLDEKLKINSIVFSSKFYNFYDDSHNEEYFSCGRTKFVESACDHYSFNSTLGWYSTFFMNRPPEVDKALSLTKFKPEYYQLADHIAKQIGPFVGAHIRLTDNQFEYPTNEQIEKGIDSLKTGFQKIIATDDPANERIIKLKSKGALVLEEIIEKEFFKDFQQLKFIDEVSLGLLVNLVMHHSKDFIGSQGSTFTGYIQRHAEGDMKIFGEQPYTVLGPFTWNGYKYPSFSPETIERNKKINYIERLFDSDNRWWREWPESRLFPKSV